MTYPAISNYPTPSAPPETDYVPPPPNNPELNRASSEPTSPPGTGFLARFAISVRNYIKANPFKSLCILVAIAGAGIAGGAYLMGAAAVMIAAGCFIFAVGLMLFASSPRSDANPFENLVHI